MTASSRMPSFYLSHGGGPWPWMDGPMLEQHRALNLFLKDLPQRLPHLPRAILMISAHWEESDFTIMSSQNPPMIYDYYGFPANTYKVQYSAPGSLDLVNQMGVLLERAQIQYRQDPNRGFDHGAFVPLAVAFPQANIPVVQLSIKKDYDPLTHIHCGRALSTLRDQGILIIGSGFSYHNLGLFGPQAFEPSHRFDQWLQKTVIEHTGQNRVDRLINWESAPASRVAHPREDHLVPLMVVCGIAEDQKAKLCYHEDRFFGGIAVSSFRFD